jgi:hypothetical protein
MSPIQRLPVLALIVAWLVSATLPAAAADRSITVKDANDALVVQISLRGSAVEIRSSGPAGPRTWLGASKSTEKRKYREADGAQVAEVKSKDGGFKVRGADGKLRWKVKLKGDKVKISDNEEGEHPYVLSTKSPDRVKVLREAIALGKVQFYPQASRIKVKSLAGAELYGVDATRLESAYGVLLLEDIPLPDRYIILAELLSREQ